MKSSRIGGRHVRYVAEADGKWIAILTFSGAVPHLKAREKWLGWSPRQRAMRLGFVINNSRFLLLVESFVDETLYRGTTALDYPDRGFYILEVIAN